MRSDEIGAFQELLTEALTFYRQDVSRFALQVWWQACQPFEIEQVRRALTRHATDPERGQFAPRPADIVRQLAGTAGDRAQLAWGKAIDAASRVGGYSDVVFDDAAIHAVIEDMGGWPGFCRTEAKDLSYLQHRFTQSYTAYVDKGQFAYPKRLMGDRSPDEMYARKGLRPPRPAVIGDIERARAVTAGGSRGGKTAITFTRVMDALERQDATALLPAEPEDVA